MTLWRFFKIPECYDDLDHYSLKSKLPLGWVTMNKKYAKAFMKGYCKERYIMDKIKVPKKDAIEYCEKHRGCVLDYYKLYTYPNNGAQKEVYVLMSSFDYDNLEADIESYGFSTVLTYLPMDIFSKKSKQVLRKLNFDEVMKLVYTSLPFNTFDDPMKDDYLNPQFIVDEFGLFLMTFQGTINESEIDSIIRYAE